MTASAAATVFVTVALIDEWRERLRSPDAWLAPDERRRAAGLRDADSRDRYVVAHRVLRLVIGERLGMPPGEVVLRSDRRGRPLAPVGAPSLAWSMAHAGGAAIVAVAEGTPVGVDVEPVDAARADLRTVGRYLDPTAAASLAGMAPDARVRATALAWTGLEAEAKGRGIPIDALRGRRRSGSLAEVDAGPAHVASIWTPAPAVVVGSPPSGR